MKGCLWGRGIFKMTERATCPRCGEKRGVRAGQSRGCQNYKCRGCKRFWRGAAPPPPPDRTCPYCGGHCHKRGSLFLSGRKPGIPSLMDQWCGMRQLRPAERVQCYICAVCGRHNTELWPSEKGAGNAVGIVPLCAGDRTGCPIRGGAGALLPDSPPALIGGDTDDFPGGVLREICHVVPRFRNAADSAAGHADAAVAGWSPQGGGAKTGQGMGVS